LSSPNKVSFKVTSYFSFFWISSNILFDYLAKSIWVSVLVTANESAGLASYFQISSLTLVKGFSSFFHSSEKLKIMWDLLFQLPFQLIWIEIQKLLLRSNCFLNFTFDVIHFIFTQVFTLNFLPQHLHWSFFSCIKEFQSFMSMLF